MPYDIAADTRLDPRIKALLGGLPQVRPRNVTSRDEILADAASETARNYHEARRAVMEACDTEEIVSSAGLSVTEYEVISQPDGNTIHVNLIRPEGDDVLPCVYYIHGGGMEAMSCFDGNYRAWGKMIAHQGSPSRWSTSATRWCPRRCPRWRRTPPA
jgi:acetyl esterase